MGMDTSWTTIPEGLTRQNEAEIISFSEALEDAKRLGAVTKILIPCIIGLLLVVGLIGNALVIWVSLTTQRIIKHPISSSLILNLAVADLIYLCSSAPYQAVLYSLPEWFYGSGLCPLLHFLNIQTMAVSIFTMCSLAIMRFMALIMPFTVQRSFVTTSARKSSGLIILTVWILASILAAPVGYFYRTIMMITPDSIETGEIAFQCTWFTVENRSERIYSTALLCITYAIPFLLVASLYFYIGKVLCEKGQIGIHYGKKKRSNNEPRQEEHCEIVKTTLMVFCLIVAFMVCWFPYHLSQQLLFSSIYSHHSYGIMRSIIEMIGLCSSYAHACVNPIIYTFASPGWKQDLCCSSEGSRRQSGDSRILRMPCRSCLNRDRSSYALASRRLSHKSSSMNNGANQEPTSTLRLTSPTSTNENSSTNVVAFTTV